MIAFFFSLIMKTAEQYFSYKKN